MQQAVPPVQTVPTQQVVEPVPPSTPPKKNNTLPFIIVGIILFITVIVIAVFLVQQFVLPSLQTAPAAIFTVPVSGKDQAKTIDLSPSVPNSQKTVVLIELSDSSFEKVIMESSLVAGYIKTLPEGDRVISQTPFGQQ